MKHLHLLFVALAFASFAGRLALAEFKPDMLAQKWLKIAPHVIAALLLLSGIALVFQGRWLEGDYGWIVAKVVVLPIFIVLGLLAMKREGTARWGFAGGALLCFLYIAKVAVSKTVFPLSKVSVGTHAELDTQRSA
ncbi:MAG: SirB2 family protein [Methylomonas sp.]|nr:SirB2 family protein [Methylomonas sp.]MBS3964519.1 SirB2 family protein [Methylomonas sp.]PPD21963.1 MAG: invasion protein [Methylomonas sp.]PPD25015.1 MAG: invasion protein [Methylomonas sp.]PPD34355.1 MAG: invasion protein [Methylomonas sp.]